MAAKQDAATGASPDSQHTAADSMDSTDTIETTTSTATAATHEAAPLMPKTGGRKSKQAFAHPAAAYLQHPGAGGYYAAAPAGIAFSPLPTSYAYYGAAAPTPAYHSFDPSMAAAAAATPLPPAVSYSSVNVAGASGGGLGGRKRDHLFDMLEVRYRDLENWLFGIGIAQMLLWFPLGLIYMVDLHPARGRTQSTIGIVFLVLAFAGCVTLAALSFVRENGNYFEYLWQYKFLCLIFVPHIVFAVCPRAERARRRHGWAAC